MVVNFAELPFPDVILPALAFSTFVKGDQLFELGQSLMLSQLILLLPRYWL
jgi:hypothetical protein